MSINMDDVDNAGGICERHGLPEVWTTDPYDYEINDQIVWLWLCPRCEADRADDI